MINPEGQQIDALEAVAKWLQRGGKRFVLAGWAGTGKTSLIPFIEDLAYNAIVVTYTNKAALVLKSKGVHGATTIHRLMYVLEDEKRMTWAKRESIQDRPSLIIVDEASMVSEKIRRDLESYGIPVLYIGDPFQLPPVKETGSVMEVADFTLTDIRRQAEGSPIIKVATAIRTGKRFPDVDQWGLTDEQIASHDVTICYTNPMRFRLNDRIRKYLGRGEAPEVGDRVIMAKTDYDLGICAGEMGVLTEVRGWLYRVLFDGYEEDVALGYTKFLGPDESPYQPEFKGRRCLDFGYCITAHKAQGSQWDKVLYWQERRADARHMYTGVTRAVKELTFGGL